MAETWVPQARSGETWAPWRSSRRWASPWHSSRRALACGGRPYKEVGC